MTPEQLRENIRLIRGLTDKPFAVNFMPENPQLESVLDVVVEEMVPVVSYGKGDPRRIIERTKPYGIINIPTVGAVKHAIRAEEYGADAVIVQGTEGGGHTGFVATMVLIPMVVDRVKIPVVAAGGIGDARGLVAALALGAEGISMGTRFIVTQECPVPLPIKERIIRSTEEDTIVTDNLTGVRCRVIRNKLAQTMVEMAEAKTSPEDMAKFAVGRFRKAFVEGDDEWGTLACGQVCGLITDIPFCRQLIEDMVQEAERILSRIKGKAGF
jgi:enoyl-[acyl-carrier protein] reductase II